MLSAVALLVLAVVLASACSDDEQPAVGGSAAEAAVLTLAVDELPWQLEQVSMTRAAETETLQNLKGKGFGLYSSDLDFHLKDNTKVTWDSESGVWDYWSPNGRVLWPQDKSKTRSLYAYAPYVSNENLAKPPVKGITNIKVDGDKVPVISFTADDANAVDLLWASALNASRTNKETDKEGNPTYNDGTVSLEFKHALARLSFGTITNNTGYKLTLRSIMVSGTLYDKGELNLATGGWKHGIDDGESRKIPHDHEPALVIGKDETEPVIVGVEDFLLIPDESSDDKGTLTVTVTITFTSDYNVLNDSDEAEEITAEFPLTLMQGQNTEVSFTVGSNHEVVITN